MNSSRLYLVLASTLAASVLAGCDGDTDRNTDFAYPQPTISVIAGATVDEDTAIGPLAFTVSDPSTPANSLVVTASTNAPAVCPQDRLVLGGTGGARTITVTPADDAVGACTIAVRVVDSDGLAATTTFGVTFREVRVNFSARSRMQFGVAANATPVETNREKFDFPDNDDNMFLAFQDLLPAP